LRRTTGRAIGGHVLMVLAFYLSSSSHYQSAFGDADPRGPIDWQKAYDDLAAYGDTSLPTYALKESEFIVIEK
jgi:hypothetical protein